MRRNTPFSVYNRTIAMHPHAMAVSKTELGQSLLGFFGAGESKLLISMVEWAGLRQAGLCEPMPLKYTVEGEGVTIPGT